jgi:hypothetical protein
VAIDLSGQGRSVKAGAVVIDIKENHPLIQLANVLPWRTLLDPVVEDLKSTTQKGFWHIGRKIKVRIHINMTMVKKKAREYFFLAKNKPIEIKREVFKKLHRFVKQQMRPVVGFCASLSQRQIAKLPWNIRRAFEQIKNDGWRYLLDVGHFTRTHTIKTGKLLSFHAKALACIKKGKIGKEFEFGRVFQLARIKGNFMFVIESTSIHMNDRASFVPLIEEHARQFGEGKIKTVAADKGYWNSKNRKALLTRGIIVEGLQMPLNRAHPEMPISGHGVVS